MRDKNNLEPSDYKTWVSDTCNSPLNAALNNLYARASVHCPIDEISIILDELHIIENVFKDYEKLQLKYRHMQDAVLDDIKEIQVLKIINEKRNRALEIIKEKRVNVDWLIEVDFDLERYNRHIAPFHRYDLNTMEIKILKEVLL